MFFRVFVQFREDQSDNNLDNNSNRGIIFHGVKIAD